MLCPLGNPFFLFIITDHLKMRALVIKAPRTSMPSCHKLCAIFKWDENNNPKIEEREEISVALRVKKTCNFNFALTFTP